MNKIKLLILLVLIGQLSFGQDKIEGLGPFKINSYTVSDLLSYAKEKDIDQIVIKDYMKQFDDYYGYVRNAKLLSFEIDTTGEVSKPYEVSYCPDQKVFMLRKFELAKMEFSSITLKFYKDTLYEIYITDPPYQFNDNIEAKYGEGRKKTEKKEESKK